MIIDEKARTVHFMNLYPASFDAIRTGRKTVEMRLNDEKRQMIKIGDLIRFTNTVTDEILTVKVVEKKRVSKLLRALLGTRQNFYRIHGYGICRPVRYV